MKTQNPTPDYTPQSTTHWPLERILFAMAGSVALLSALLAALVSPWFLLLTAFVGLSQWAYVLTRACPASIILKKFGAEVQCTL